MKIETMENNVQSVITYVRAFGTGAHVHLPFAWLGKKVRVEVLD